MPCLEPKPQRTLRKFAPKQTWKPSQQPLALTRRRRRKREMPTQTPATTRFHGHRSCVTKAWLRRDSVPRQCLLRRCMVQEPSEARARTTARSGIVHFMSADVGTATPLFHSDEGGIYRAGLGDAKGHGILRLDELMTLVTMDFSLRPRLHTLQVLLPVRRHDFRQQKSQAWTASAFGASQAFRVPRFRAVYDVWFRPDGLGRRVSGLGQRGRFRL